ncbi:MAG: tetratricopeptide repeat protein, partial [Acidobacteriota bacterium]|nr:tetratricopeptide repeat protein [Acidobacteriota bacterium]
VFGESRRPVSDVHVELLNDLYSMIGRAKTDGSGRYTFPGIPQGNYKVRVLPYGTDYAEQSQDVNITNVSLLSGGGAESVQLDFYLRLRENANAGPFAAPGTLFAQEVPAEAKKLYERAINDLREKREKEGFESLKRSLELFPTYYLALDRLGTEYVVRGYYEAAHILLTKAVEVNPRGFSSVLGLGLAQYQLKLTNEAIDNLKRATSLYAKSVNAHLWLGAALKRAGKLDQAEVSFKRAKELSKGKVADVHWQLARLYSEQKRYKEAADELELFLKNQPDSRDAEKIKQMIAQLKEKAAK